MFPAPLRLFSSPSPPRRRRRAGDGGVPASDDPVADAWSRRRDTTDRTERDAAPDDARDGVVVAGLALLMLFASFAILP